MSTEAMRETVDIDMSEMKRVEIVNTIRHVETLDEAVKLMKGLGRNGWLALFPADEQAATANQEVIIKAALDAAEERVRCAWGPAAAGAIRQITTQQVMERMK